MSFADFGVQRGANIPEHNRLRGLDQGDPHPQYQAAGEYAAADHDHDDGVWLDYEPTWTNLTEGSATTSYSYTRVGNLIHYRGHVAFGAGTSIGGSVLVSIPVDAKAGVPFIGTAKAEDTSASFARTVGLAEITTTVWGQNINFSSDGLASWDTTNPITWASGDGIAWSITYEAAA